MENQIILITDRATLSNEIALAFEKALKKNVDANHGDLSEKRMTITEAARYVGMSIPTFSKRVKEGVFPKHGAERKIHFFKSELNQVLTAKTNGHE